jgi:hypothetical protein
VSITEKLLKWRVGETKAGRTPTRIELSREEYAELERWCAATETVVQAPDGSTRRIAGVSARMIFGLVVEVRD